MKNTLYHTCANTMALATMTALVLNWTVSPAKALGLIVGTGFSCLNFALIPVGWRFCLAADSKRAGVLAFASLMGRYLVLSLPLVFAAGNPKIDFWTTAAGILSIQIYLVAANTLTRIRQAAFGQTGKGESVK